MSLIIGSPNKEQFLLNWKVKLKETKGVKIRQDLKH